MIEGKSEKRSEHIEDLPEIKAALDEMAQDRLKTGRRHLNTDELLDYLDDNLRAEDPHIRERLVFDKEAVSDLLAMDAFPRVSDLPSEERDEENEAAWSDFNNRLQEETHKDGLEEPPTHPNLLPHYLLHAVLAAACLILAFTQPFKTASPSDNRPNLQVSILEVRLDEVGTRAIEKPLLSFQGPRQTLYVKLPRSQRDFPYYGLEILDEESRLIFSDLVPGPLPHLGCQLVEDFFKQPGSYHIRIFGQRDEKKTDLGGFDLLVEL